MRFLVAVLLVASSLAVLVAAPSASSAGPLVPEVGGGPSIPNAPPVPGPRDAPFAANVQVSEADTPGNQNEISVAVQADGRIHMGWNDMREPNPDYRCGYSYSTDGGLTWAANRLFLLPGWEAAGDPVLFVDGNDDVYFICMSFNRTVWGSRIVVYKSTDGGVTWSNGTVASDTTTGLNDKPWGYAIGTTLFVCYANFGAAPNELRATRSFDGGLTWEATQIVGTSGNGCGYAHTSPTNVVLGWLRGGAIYAHRSTDGGANWGPATFVGAAPFTQAGDQRAAALPSFASDPARGRLYAVWPANDGLGTWDVRSSRSTDGGATWSAAVTVNDVRTGRQFMAWADVGADGTVHVAWYDERSGLMAVRYSNSTDLGATWLPSLRVTDTEWPTAFFIGDYIALDVDLDGNVNVGWCDRRTGENEAFFARIPSLGPPRLARIDVAPPQAWTDADSPVLFTAAGFDQYGSPYPASPSWAATGGSVSAGLYTPQRVGDWRVWANQSTVSGSADVHVSAGALARIEVTPPDVAITADDTQAYAATGYDAHDNVVPVSPSWGVTDGTISGSGVFAPRRAGTWLVYANASGVSGSTGVQVVPGVLASIAVDPPSVTIAADEVQWFTATGHDAKGNVVPIAPAWAASAGAVSPAGLYTPGPVGNWTVFANASGLSGSAQVTVTLGALASIAVSPADLVITADDTVQYVATGYDLRGNPFPYPISPTWSASAGAISGIGLYTPGPVGLHAITATVGNVSGSTGVTVTPGALARIDVDPPTATITADQTLPLTARGYDAKGNRVAIAPTWEATCGTVDGAGLYTPGPARLCVAYANESGLSGSSQITVVAGALARIDVTPPTAAITADEQQAYAAAGFDAKGNPVPIVPTWSAAEGSISAAGLYTPRFVGTWTITAAVGPVYGSAEVVVAPGALAAIFVTPPSPTITADDVQAFAASGRDGKGNEVPLTAPAWSAMDGTISAAGVFTPERTGVWEVAAAEAGIRGTAVVTVLPGAVRSVTITPPAGAVEEGYIIHFQADAFDGKGNPVPDAEFTWSVEGDIGAVDETGEFSAGPGGAGRVVVTATGGGGTATGAAPVSVSASPGWVLLWLVPIVGAFLLMLLFFLARRRRRRGNPPGD